MALTVTAQEIMHLVTAQQLEVSVEELVEEAAEQQEEKEKGETQHRVQPKQLTATNLRDLMKLCEFLKVKVMELYPEIARVHTA